MFIRILSTPKEHDGEVSADAVPVEHGEHGGAAAFVVLKEVDVLFSLTLNMTLVFAAIACVWGADV